MDELSLCFESIQFKSERREDFKLFTWLNESPEENESMHGADYRQRDGVVCMECCVV